MDLAMEINDECRNNNLKNYFLFNRELNVRDMTLFLNNFDYAICMRFHACIFLKSLDIPVYGIDYTAGEIGKVGGLFKSFNDPNYSNILEIDTEQINSFILKHQN
jgi:polysaccharide pyruvyl transferase WcaK-like protein